jgi:hypothetical protein
MTATQLVKGSLQHVSQTTGKPIAETFLSVDALVLVDTSASMSAQDCPNIGGRKRYDVACEQLIRLQKDLPGKVGVISWSSHAIFCPGGIPVFLQGGTDMAGALKFIRAADNTSIKLILISDGEPDNESDALRIAGQFKSKIDCIFVGPESSPGRDFLRRLAAATGGVSVSQSVKDIANLSTTVTRLLTA